MIEGRWSRWKGGSAYPIRDGFEPRALPLVTMGPWSNGRAPCIHAAAMRVRLPSGPFSVRRVSHARWMELPSRITDRIDSSGGPDACHEWQGSTIKGYGYVGWQGKVVKVHRLVWIAANGEPPTDKPCVLHTCDNPPCANLAHLYAGTHADNMRDMAERGRARNSPPVGDDHWRRKHPERVPRGEDAAGATLTAEQVEAIRAEPQAWGVIVRLAREYSVSHTTISRVRRGMRYSDGPPRPRRYAVDVVETRTATVYVTASDDPAARASVIANQWDEADVGEPHLVVKSVRRFDG